MRAVSTVDALFWVVCLVLVVAGAAKVTDPSQVATTLSALGVGRRGDRPLLTARMLGVVEVVTAVAALTVGGRLLAAVVALCYAGFAVVVLAARRRGLPSCGCFGARSAPPSRVHVAVNVASAAVAVAAAVAGRGGGGPEPVADGLGGLGAIGLVVAGLVLLAAAMVVVVDTLVAEVVEETGALRHQGADATPVGREGT